VQIQRSLKPICCQRDSWRWTDNRATQTLTCAGKSFPKSSNRCFDKKHNLKYLNTHDTLLTFNFVGQRHLTFFSELQTVGDGVLVGHCWYSCIFACRGTVMFENSAKHIFHIAEYDNDTTSIWTCKLNNYRVAQNSDPLPNHQKIGPNRIKACQWD